MHRGRGAFEARPTGRRALARPRGGVFALAKTAVSAINTCGMGVCFAYHSELPLFGFHESL